MYVGFVSTQIVDDDRCTRCTQLKLTLICYQEKPLRISGDPSKVEHAKQLVYELLADKDMQGGGGGGGGGQRPYDDGYQNQDQGNGLATNSTEVIYIWYDKNVQKKEKRYS